MGSQKQSQAKIKILKLLNAMAEYHSADMSDSKLEMFAGDLATTSPEDIAAAWRVYRSRPENVFMPTPAQLKALVPDGRPSANEAWGMMPHDESQTVVWTTEMAKAWSVAVPLLSQGERRGAFFAFKESYEKSVAEAKASGAPPKWQVSLGFDPAGRVDAVKQAVDQGRLTISQGRQFVPELAAPQERPQLESGEKHVMSIAASVTKTVDAV